LPSTGQAAGKSLAWIITHVYLPIWSNLDAIQFLIPGGIWDVQRDRRLRAVMHPSQIMKTLKIASKGQRFHAAEEMLNHREGNYSKCQRLFSQTKQLSGGCFADDKVFAFGRWTVLEQMIFEWVYFQVLPTTGVGKKSNFHAKADNSKLSINNLFNSQLMSCPDLPHM